MIDFAKGHGTGNDFVIVADFDNTAPPTEEAVARLCDRRFGVGGDGLLRVVRAAADPESADQDATWFMDHRNADGSKAQMCGNGVRVFARYLLENGLVDADAFPVATRSGVRTVHVDGADLRVDVGPVRVLGETKVTVGDTIYSGVHMSTGNPHAVCRVPDPAALDLTKTPDVDRRLFPTGTNIEFFSGDAEAITMRVHERGVGETLSCGTGACAAATAALAGPGTCRVTVPGGTLTVTVTPDTALLSGPAEIVFTGRARL